MTKEAKEAEPDAAEQNDKVSFALDGIRNSEANVTDGEEGNG